MMRKWLIPSEQLAYFDDVIVPMTADSDFEYYRFEIPKTMKPLRHLISSLKGDFGTPLDGQSFEFLFETCKNFREKSERLGGE